MSLCPNKSSKEWKRLIDNLKIYLIELDMYKDDEDVEQWGLFSFIRFGTGEIPNPVQSMRIIVKEDEEKSKRFEKYLLNSSRDDNYRWRIQCLPKENQKNIIRHLSILSFAKKRGENKEFLDKLHMYLRLFRLNENN